MVDRHYSLDLKPWSARTLYVYAHADLAQKYSIGLQEIFVSRLCSQEENCWTCSTSCTSHDVINVYIFRNLKGIIVTLDETGYVYCSYLGTDPSLFVTPPAHSRDVQYDVSNDIATRCPQSGRRGT
jgi:hypothetical protein